MYLPPRSSGAAVHEYLTPGVEIVSVDPNCAYNSPISLSDTTVSDADDDECNSAATDDYLMQMNQHQHALGVVVVDDDDDDEVVEEEDDFDVAVRAGIAASPAAYAEAVEMAGATGNSAMCPTTSRSQTCLDDDNLNEENFDLAAYITDNDYDFQTTVDHSDALLSVHATAANTTMDRQPDSTTVSVAELGLVAAAVATMSYEQCIGSVAPPHTFMDNCMTGLQPSQTLFPGDNVMSVERVSAISQVAAMAGNETDTYSYVEKWLASCMYDETSSAESIGLSLVADSPSNLLLEAIDDAATEALRAATDTMLQQQLLHVVTEPQQLIFEKPMQTSTIADVVNSQSPVYIRPPPVHGKGRGKKISMYATVQASDDNEDDDEDEDDDEENDEPIIVDVEEFEMIAAAMPAAITVVDVPVNPSEKAARTTLFDLTIYRSARQQQKSPIALAVSPGQMAQPSFVPIAPVVTIVPTIPTTTAIASTKRRRAVAQKRLPGLTAPAPAPVVLATKVLSSSESDNNDDENGSHADNYAPSRSSSDCSGDSTPAQHKQQQLEMQQRLRRNAARRQPVQADKPTTSTTTVMPTVVPAVQSMPLRQQRTSTNAQASAPTIGGGGPSRRKFRSKSYISSSSGSSDDEASKIKPQPTNKDTSSSTVARPSDTNVKCDTIVKTSKITAEPARQQTSQPPKVVSRGVPAKPNSRSLLKPANSGGERNQKKTTATLNVSDSMKRHRSADQLPPSKRKLSVASVSSGDQRLAAPATAPIGALEETLLSLDDAAQRSGAGGSQSQQPLRKQRKVLPNNHRTILLTNTLQQQARQPTPKRSATDAFAMAPASTVGVRPPRASLLRVRSMDAGTSKTQASERRLAVADGANGAINLHQPTDTVMTPVAAATPPTTTVIDDVVAIATCSAAEAAEQQSKKRLNLDEYLKRRRLNNETNPSATTSIISNKPLTMPSFKIPKKVSAIAGNSGNKPTATGCTSTRPTAEGAAVQGQAPRNHKHLEEIVIVSMGCNTDVTLPCSAASGSGSLLTNINDTIIKAQQQGGVAAAVKISSNSLIASIQDVLIKKCNTETSADPADSAVATTASVADTQSSITNSTVEHGEDKIIMYLPKDRRKTVGTSIECQTDNMLQFPPLKRLRRRRHYRKHSRRSVTPSTQQPHRQQQKRRHRTSRDQRTRSRSRTRDRSPYSSTSSASGRQRSASRASSYSNSSSSSSSSSCSDSSSSSSSYTTEGSRRRSRSRSHSRSRPAHLERRGSSAGGPHRPPQQPQQQHRQNHHHLHRQPRQRQHGHHGNRPGKFFGDGERSQRWRAPSNSSSRLAAEAYRTGGGGDGVGAGAVDARIRSNSDSSDSGTRPAFAAATANAPTGSDSTAVAKPSNNAAFSSARSNGKRNLAIWCDSNDEEDDSGQMKVIDERRIVYVGRIEETTSQDVLREKFLRYGPIQEVSLHYKESSLKFGFVTYAYAKDAYRAIDCSMKDPLINMYDVSFGGRRAFCKSMYMDLDGNQFNQQSHVVKPTAPPKSKEPFEVMLRKMREDLNEKRSSAMRGQAH